METWANCDSRSELSLIDGLYTWRPELTVTLGQLSLINGLYTWRPELTMPLGQLSFDWWIVYLETWANCDSRSAEFDCPLPEIWLSWASSSDITLSFSSTVFFKASLKITCFSALPRVFSVLRTTWEQITKLTFKGTVDVISNDPGLSIWRVACPTHNSTL